MKMTPRMRAWRFSPASPAAGSPVLEHRHEHLEAAHGEPARFRQSWCRFRGCSPSAVASSTEPADENRDGISTPCTRSPPTASAAIVGHERRIDPAGQSHQHVGEAVLADVVRRSEHERLVDLRDPAQVGAPSGADRCVSRRRRRPRRQRSGRPSSTAAAAMPSWPRGSSSRLRNVGRITTSQTVKASSNCGADATSSPSWSKTIDAPSKTSSSWPPTRFT